MRFGSRCSDGHSVLFSFVFVSSLSDYGWLYIYFVCLFSNRLSSGKKKVVEIEIGGPMMVHNLLSLLKRDSKLLWKGHKTKDKKKGGVAQILTHCHFEWDT